MDYSNIDDTSGHTLYEIVNENSEVLNPKS